jgi:hypothetical protein
MPYLGKTPSQGVRSRYQFTPNAGTTSISGADANGDTLTFTDGNYVDVYLNGVMLKAGVDYVTTTANTIGSLAATVASDVVDIIVYDTFSVFGGTIEGNVTVSNGTLDVSGDITGSTLNADGDTAAGDNAAIGYTSAEGLILTGQGSTNDVTIKNDADADVITIATGTTVVGIPGSLDVEGAIDVNGTANLDVVDIDGAVDMASTLQVDGAITSSAGATISTTGQEFQLILTSTDADALQGPRLKLYRNSSSPADGDATGEFTFVGRNDNSQDVDYFQIRTDATDVSDGTEDATVHFFHMRAGTIRSSLTFAPTETIFNDDSRDLDFRVESDGNANMLFVDGGTDTVTIGTSSTDAYSSADNLIVGTGSGHNGMTIFSANDSQGTIFFADALGGDSDASTYDGYIIYDHSARHFRFGTAATERMRIDSSGNVGIGTDAPSDYNSAAHNLVIYESGGSGMTLASGTSGQGAIYFADGTSGDAEYRGYIIYEHGSNDHMRFGTGGAEHMRIDSNGKVGIGITPLASTTGNGLGAAFSTLAIKASDTVTQALSIDATNAAGPNFMISSYSDGSGSYYMLGANLLLATDGSVAYETNGENMSGIILDSRAGNGIQFYTAAHDGSSYVPAERMRIDSSGNAMVGTTTVLPHESSTTSQAGISLAGQYDFLSVARDQNGCAGFNRMTNDGEIIGFRKDGTSAGSIGCHNSGTEFYITGTASTCSGVFFNVNGVLPMVNGSVSDNTEDLGQPDLRWDDVHATNGTIQTSDENEKQDIASMTTAELAVGKRLSALFKTFRWKSKVTEKADKARTHSGIVAQQVKAAFEAESLDATKYALFCSDTWWEKEISVDAVEADEEKGIEAKDAYKYMDNKYVETDGYSEKTRMGIRYPELLSFIASYNESRFTAIEARIAKLEE